MTRARGSGRTLTREDWLGAAVTAMTHGGARAVAVEPLAKTLRATKGSFYWHFRDREDLVRCALEQWEQRETQAVIDGLESISEPRERLRRLLEAIHQRLTERPDPSVALSGDTETAVGLALERVTARRIEFVAEQVAALGIAPSEARRRALLAYTSYLGFATLSRSAPKMLPVDDAVGAYLDTVLDALASGAPSPL